MKDDNKIEELKQLLLDTDLQKLEEIDIRLKDVASDLYIRERLEKHVNPIIEEKIETFQREIPETMGPAITAALRKQIKESQNEVVDLLYPLIGKLIAKYIRIEIERLSEKIDRQFKNTFSWEVWKRRIKAWFSGNKESDLVLSELVAPEIHDVFMVSKGSGILMGTYSNSETLNTDLVAGMLTAIKSFAEDAFKKDAVELELIEYESFKIKLFNLGSFYLAITITGVMDSAFKENLQSQVNKFIENKLKKIVDREDHDFSNEIKEIFSGEKS